MPSDMNLVQKDSDIEIVSMLAKEIWEEHYIPLIGSSQVEYMLDKFQSHKAIRSQIIEGHEYYLAKYENEYSGYAALVVDNEKSTIKISKLYTLGSVRGKGLGLAIMEYIENKCRSEGISALWLTVNKYNHNSIAWYKNRGFKVIRDEKTDIGNGYYMDDYVMEKSFLNKV